MHGDNNKLMGIYQQPEQERKMKKKNRNRKDNNSSIKVILWCWILSAMLLAIFFNQMASAVT